MTTSKQKKKAAATLIIGTCLLYVATLIFDGPTEQPLQLQQDVGESSALRRSLQQDGAEPAKCLLHLTDCNLSCLDWTIVLATGRSGSTTIQQMISKLPGMNFYGEEGGLLMSTFHELQGYISHIGQKTESSLSVSRTYYI